MPEVRETGDGAVTAHDFGQIDGWSIARLQHHDVKNARVEVRFIAALVRMDGTLAAGGKRSEVSVSVHDLSFCAYAYPCDPVSGERRDVRRRLERTLAPDPIPLTVLGTLVGMREDALKRARVKSGEQK